MVSRQSDPPASRHDDDEAEGTLQLLVEATFLFIVASYMASGGTIEGFIENPWVASYTMIIEELANPIHVAGLTAPAWFYILGGLLFIRIVFR